ncbi:hypothetical protein HCQ94_00050 [Actinomyces sp. zg-332]|uniref:DUF6891 domain-containing protein n=1 Tax=Actinomyces sp. zg-332 TaxID=2708340 RepID=UPI00142372E7|nr:hypothetical protein [Actinomyces sp. zg-332]QPK94153.1 hypothetical protein HCQ94_00050 [Actinomyces sp. zg-332]
MIKYADFVERYTFPEGINLSDDIKEEILSSSWEYLITLPNIEDIICCIQDLLEDSEYSISEENIEIIAKSIIECRRKQIADYKNSPEYKPSRLTAAFKELRENNVLALENFSCCGTCASSEAYDLMYEEEEWFAYIYFHQQDTEILVEDGRTYLGYECKWTKICSEEDYDAMAEEERHGVYLNECKKLADEILKPTFNKHGIEFTWNYDLGTRMHISNADFFADIEDE